MEVRSVELIERLDLGTLHPRRLPNLSILGRRL